MSDEQATSGPDQQRGAGADSDVADRPGAPGESGHPDRPQSGDVDQTGTGAPAAAGAAGGDAPGGDAPGTAAPEAATGTSGPDAADAAAPAHDPAPKPHAPVPGPPPGGRARPTPPPRPPAGGPAAAAAAAPTPVAAVPGHVTVSPVPEASADPSRWGRVDDEGTVYLVTTEGERVVGSWQAGAPAEGLAHFARRFDDLRTEAELLAARLSAGGGDPKHALTSAKTMREQLVEATVVGDVAGLRTRLDELIALAETAVGAARHARDAQRAEALARKEALAAEADELAAEATQWKQAGDRFKAILDEWRTIKGIDRKTDEALWKRFSKSREAFNRRRGSHFADLDRQRAGAKARKEELTVEAESLADSTDWGPTAARYRELMAEWKAAGRAQKDTDDVLWQRFRGAQDAFFSHRSATFAERDAEFVANAEAKKALLNEAEKIDGSDPDSARAALRDIQERWEEIGKVPRDDIRGLEAGLRAVEERIRDAVDRQWRRRDPEADARVAQFRDRVTQFEAQAEKAKAAGDARREKEALAQAAQWREWLTTAEQAVQQG